MGFTKMQLDQRVLNVWQEARDIPISCLPQTCRTVLQDILDPKCLLGTGDYRIFGENFGLTPQQIRGLESRVCNGESVTGAILNAVRNQSVWKLLQVLGEMGVCGRETILDHWTEIRANYMRDRCRGQSSSRSGIPNSETSMACGCQQCLMNVSSLHQWYPQPHYPQHPRFQYPRQRLHQHHYQQQQQPRPPYQRVEPNHVQMSHLKALSTSKPVPVCSNTPERGRLVRQENVPSDFDVFDQTTKFTNMSCSSPLRNVRLLSEEDNSLFEHEAVQGQGEDGAFGGNGENVQGTLGAERPEAQGNDLLDSCVNDGAQTPQHNCLSRGFERQESTECNQCNGEEDHDDHVGSDITALKTGGNNNWIPPDIISLASSASEQEYNSSLFQEGSNFMIMKHKKETMAETPSQNLRCEVPSKSSSQMAPQPQIDNGSLPRADATNQPGNSSMARDQDTRPKTGHSPQSFPPRCAVYPPHVGNPDCSPCFMPSCCDEAGHSMETKALPDICVDETDPSHQTFPKTIPEPRTFPPDFHGNVMQAQYIYGPNHSYPQFSQNGPHMNANLYGPWNVQDCMHASVAVNNPVEQSYARHYRDPSHTNWPMQQGVRVPARVGPGMMPVRTQHMLNYQQQEPVYVKQTSRLAGNCQQTAVTTQQTPMSVQGPMYVGQMSMFQGPHQTSVMTTEQLQIPIQGQMPAEQTSMLLGPVQTTNPKQTFQEQELVMSQENDNLQVPVENGVKKRENRSSAAKNRVMKSLSDPEEHKIKGDDGKEQREPELRRQNSDPPRHVSPPKLDPFVFVTGGDESQATQDKIEKLCSALFKRGIPVIADMFKGILALVPECSVKALTSFHQQNLTEATTHYFRTAKCVIMAVSTAYRNYISATEPFEASPNDHRSSTRYIYTLMLEEFAHRNFSRNKRFFPVCVGHNTTRADIPEWISSTLVYRYPEGKSALVQHLKQDMEEDRK